MADETIADDEAIYDIWRRLSAEQVEAIFQRVYQLAHTFFVRRGLDPTPAMIAEARDLRDGPLRLGHLPFIREIAEA